MKQHISRSQWPTVSLVTIFNLIVCTNVAAQQMKTPEPKDFKITIERTVDGLKMQSADGCAWINLSFTNNNYQPRYINEFGLTDPANTSVEKDARLAHFLLLVQKTEKGIALKGINGTAWTSLNFSLALNEKQTINRYGMVASNKIQERQ